MRELKTYKYMSLTEKSELVTGEIWASMAYSGDALMIQEYNKNIEYIVPEEGGNLWVDYFAVLSSSTRKELAKAFINFINIPKNAARNAIFVHYATPNTAAKKLLPIEFLADSTIYPDDNVLKNSEFFAELPPKILKKRNTIFSNLINQ